MLCCWLCDAFKRPLFTRLKAYSLSCIVDIAFCSCHVRNLGDVCMGAMLLLVLWSMLVVTGYAFSFFDGDGAGKGCMRQ